MAHQSNLQSILHGIARAIRAGFSSGTVDAAAVFDLAPRHLDPEIERTLLAHVDAAWQRGWQPSEVVREAMRGTSAKAAGRLATWAVATDHAGRRSVTLDRRWVEQVEGLELPAVSGGPGWLAAWAVDEALDRLAVIEGASDLLACLQWLPRLDPILPPPGSGAGASIPPSVNQMLGADADPVLIKVRNLLAKAESTNFEAEALAFTVKAHELMARHAIDTAQLHGTTHGVGDERPITIRLPVDAPYVKAKSLLLQVVADAGRCRAVQHSRLGLSSVVGFATDVAAVELLFTSLLVQAQAALAAATEHAPPGTRVRSQSYRSSFFWAYAHRIGDRLDEINAAVLAEAEVRHGTTLLPVLRSRAEIVDEHLTAQFGKLRVSRSRHGWDPAGWAGGQVAADNAQLNAGNLRGAKQGLCSGPWPPP